MKKVFKIAWLYRKKFLWKKTLEDLFNWEPLDALEKIEFFLEAIRLVNTLWFEKVWNLKQFENINKNEVRNTAFTFLKNEKIVGNNVYALAAKYLLEAWWENVFENIEEDQLHSYYKLEITVDDLYKSNKDFDYLPEESILVHQEAHRPSTKMPAPYLSAKQKGIPQACLQTRLNNWHWSVKPCHS